MFKSIVLAALVGSSYASFEKIKTFTPLTGVNDHAAIAGDQASLEKLVAGKTPGTFDQAKLVYSEGGNSKSVATLNVPGGVPATIAAGTTLTATGVDGRTVVGVADQASPANSNTIYFKYPVDQTPGDHLDCRVGGLPVNERITEGCLVAGGTLRADKVADEITYEYTVETDNDNGRTLKKFSTDANTRMRPGDDTSKAYFTDFQKFVNYYNAFDYADKIISAGFDGTNTNLANGDVNLQSAGTGFDGRLEIIKKGTAYLSVAMYVIRELEDAIYDCDTKCSVGQCNDDDAVHALDEAVAFYYGTDEYDVFHHSLANKRCANFGTCSGDCPLEGDANVNVNIFTLFGEMQSHLQRAECDEARPLVQEISKQMWVPLIQGTLRYAWILDETNNPGASLSEKAQAEGAIFAAGVLPIIHDCDANAAATIYDNMKIQTNINVDFTAVKQAFESCYDKIGITCADVGGIVNSAGSAYDSDLTRPCGGFANVPNGACPATPSSASTAAIGTFVGASIVAIIAMLV